MLYYISLIFVGPFLVTLYQALTTKSKTKNAEDFYINGKILMGNTLIMVAQYLVGLNITMTVFESLNLEFGLFNIVPWPLTFLICFVVTDFLYYVKHYVHHKSQFLWKIHQVHHSSLQFNLSTAYRLSWFSFLITPLFYSPAVLLGFSPVMVLSCVFLIRVYNHLLHFDQDISLGFLNLFLVSPNDHRIHHSSYEKHIDKNMGGVLNVWDKVFDTYTSDSLDKVVYGTTDREYLRNPFRIVFQGWLK